MIALHFPRIRALRHARILAVLALVTTPALYLFGSPSAAHAQTSLYTLEDLGALPGDASSIPWGINARGQVVGWSGSAPTRAFLYTDGIGMVELPGLPGHTNTLARGVNDQGVVVGSGWGPGIPSHALRWTNGIVEDLGVLEGTSQAWDVNGAGVTVGASPTADYFVRHAFVHTDASGAFDLLPGENAIAYDVNELGQVAGSASGAAFLWSSASEVQFLGPLPDFASNEGRALNISGQLAGFVTSATGSRQRVVRYTPGLGLVEIGGAGETNQPWGINARGDLVGLGVPTTGLKRAFVYTDGAGLQSLSELTDASPQWFLLAATDINDAGQIVGYGHDNSTAGGSRGFRLTPVTPQGPLAALSLSPVRVEGGSSVTGWVTLTEPAPEGGAGVALTSDDPVLAEVPASVIVPQGERFASFTANTVSPASSEGAILTATYGGKSRTAVLTVDPAGVTAVGPGSGDGMLLRGLRLYPNPARIEVQIRFDLSVSVDVDVRISDVRGRTVRSFRVPNLPDGANRLAWNLRDTAGVPVRPGIYWIELSAGPRRNGMRVVVLP